MINWTDQAIEFLWLKITIELGTYEEFKPKVSACDRAFRSQRTKCFIDMIPSLNKLIGDGEEISSWKQVEGQFDRVWNHRGGRMTPSVLTNFLYAWKSGFITTDHFKNEICN